MVERITTYHYNNVWSKRPIDSSRFGKPDGHQNPGNWSFDSWTGQARAVTVGVFKLPHALVRQIHNAQPLSIGQGEFDALPDEIRSTVKLDGGRY